MASIISKSIHKALEVLDVPYLTKSLVYEALDIPFHDKDETYTCMRFAQEASEGCIAVIREPFAKRDYHSPEGTCKRLAKTAVDRGAKLLLCEYEIEGYDILKVEDSFAAWVKITAAYRSNFTPKTVCVTGSIGKTSTTALTKAVFSRSFRTFCNTGNTNSPNYSSRNAQQLTTKIEAYIQEVMEDPFGCPGDISKMVQPQAAIITVIGSSHLISLGSQDTILESCLTIQNGMPEDGLLILNGDDPVQLAAKCNHRKVFYSVNNPNADYRAQNIREEDGKLYFEIAYKGNTVPVVLNCFGKHNAGNAAAAFAAGKWAGLSDEQIVRGLADYRPFGIRQNLVEHGGYRLFLDCYNAAPESMKSALETLMTIKPKDGGKHIAVLADIKESGRQEDDYHLEVGRLAAECGIDVLICFGNSARLIAEGAYKNGLSAVYMTSEGYELEKLLRCLITRQDVALFKGSRGMALEKYVDNVYGTWFHEKDDDAISKSKSVSSGAFRYYVYPDHAKVTEKLTSNTDVCIPNSIEGIPVTGIERNVFANSKSYTTSVVFPATLKNIREKAFYTVSRLETVKMPNSLLYIAVSAFEACKGLKSVDINEGCIAIASRAFAECRNLQNVTIPSSVHEISDDAFCGCPKLTIICRNGSFAEQYAKDHNIPCSCLKQNSKVINNSATDEEGIQSSEVGYLHYSSILRQNEKDMSKYPGIARFQKSVIDYQYIISRSDSDKLHRQFLFEDGIWKQSEFSEHAPVTILCGGDLMCEPGMSEACFFAGDYDYRSCFKYLRPVLAEADFAIANLETIVSENIPYAHEKHKVAHHTGARYHCNAPFSYLEALKYAGFDGFVLANNHNADGGYTGIIDTLNNLDELGFMHTGLYRDETEPRILQVDLNGIRVAFLSYTEHINRNLDTEVLSEEGCKIMLNRYSDEKLGYDISKAKGSGAEFIIVYIHFLGKEYSHEITEGQRKLAQKIANLGADCIMGSHMHAIQHYDTLVTTDNRRVPVMYSLGNLISSDATKDLIARRSVLYKLQLKKENGRVVIDNESYIPLRVVEGTRGSSFIAFPTPSIYRNNSKSSFFEEAQSLIVEEVGDKIAPFGSEKTNETQQPEKNHHRDNKMLDMSKKAITKLKNRH